MWSELSFGLPRPTSGNGNPKGREVLTRRADGTFYRRCYEYVLLQDTSNRLEIESSAHSWKTCLLYKNPSLIHLSVRDSIVVTRDVSISLPIRNTHKDRPAEIADSGHLRLSDGPRSSFSQSALQIVQTKIACFQQKPGTCPPADLHTPKSHTTSSSCHSTRPAHSPYHPVSSRSQNSVQMSQSLP